MPPSLLPPPTNLDALFALALIALVFAGGCGALACGGVARALDPANGTTWLVAVGAGLCVLAPVWIGAIMALRRWTRV